MIGLLYMGILLLCYGIYNISCYRWMLPTHCAGMRMLQYGRERRHLTMEFSWSYIWVAWLSDQVPWDLERLGKGLENNPVGISDGIYMTGRGMVFFMGAIILLPLSRFGGDNFTKILGLWLALIALDLSKCYVCYVYEKRNRGKCKGIFNNKRMKQILDIGIELLRGVLFFCFLYSICTLYP